MQMLFTLSSLYDCIHLRLYGSAASFTHLEKKQKNSESYKCESLEQKRHREGIVKEVEEQDGEDEKAWLTVRQADRLYPSIQTIEDERQQEPSAV